MSRGRGSRERGSRGEVSRARSKLLVERSAKRMIDNLKSSGGGGRRGRGLRGGRGDRGE